MTSNELAVTFGRLNFTDDGRMEVEVFYKTVRGNPAHDGQISITLARNGAKKTIYSDDEDRNPFFVDIGWSADSRVVSVWELDGLTREISFVRIDKSTRM